MPPIKTASNVSAIKDAAGIRVRMYRVGFGDFFLLSLKAGRKVAHILIDCGVHAKPTGSIDDAIAQLLADTGGKLALIVMTHRHADHISGFASGAATFKKFTVDKVWMPWFENPKNTVAVKFQANLTAVAQRLQLALAATNSPADEQYRLMAENALGLDLAGRSSNDIALEVLHSGFANQPQIDYLKAGDVPPLPVSLSSIGLAARILGPPIDPKLISQMDGANHQYLDTLDADNIEAQDNSVFDPRFVVDAPAYEDAAFDAEALKKVQRKIVNSQPEVVRAIAAKTDNTLNNQSIVTLFEFNGKKLLFAGDAQWGNWQNMLFGGIFGTSGHTKLSKEAKDILGSIDFYKVGHHGSTNATPIDALDAMKQGVVAMCSTAEGAYGCDENKSEVPRKPLMQALTAKTGGKLARSDQAPVTGAPAIGPPLNAVFEMPTHKLFIDYHF